MTGVPHGTLPAVSVVMPTFQRRASLRRTLEALALVDYPPDRLELVVVCDGCTDGSAGMVAGLGLPFACRVVEQANQGPAAARNRGLAEAGGDLALFLDDDVVPAPDLVAAHARAHLEAPAEQRVVIGALLPPGVPRSPWVRWELDTVVKQYEAMREGRYEPTPRQFYTGNASVGIAHVLDAGGFDTSFLRGEDVELAFRLQARGLRFVFRPEASGVHMAERSLGSWLRTAYSYGRNDVVLGVRRGRPDMLRALAEEFWERNWLTRRLVAGTLRARGLERALAVPGGAAAVLLQRLHRDRLAHGACSVLFSLAYWRGVSDELGGPARARALIASAVPGAPAAS